MEKKILPYDIESKVRFLTKNAIVFEVTFYFEDNGKCKQENFDVIVNKNGQISMSPEIQGISLKGNIKAHCKKRANVAFGKK